MSQPQRLQKILAEMGIASRRGAEGMILEGRVTINGRIAQVGDKADPLKDAIKVDDRRLAVSAAAEKVYVLLHKPKGVVTTVEDPEGRTTVMDLVKIPKVRLFPVGRLDYDAEGFLLLTNDGELAHQLTHPSFNIPRIYNVKIKGKPPLEDIRRMSRGIILEDGWTAPCRISPIQETEGNLWVEMVMHEGRNRQIKRMWEKLGYFVLKLKRVAFGGLGLGRLKTGECRALRSTEVERLKRLVAGAADRKPQEGIRIIPDRKKGRRALPAKADGRRGPKTESRRQRPDVRRKKS